MSIGIEFYALALVIAVNLVYYFIYCKVAFGTPPTPQGNSGADVSVIVCAKNEQENLKRLIPLLLQQKHPNFEIILINDASIDDTGDVIEGFVNQDHRVKMVNVENNENFWANKKYALTLGIKKAVNDKLIFIDADCVPNSEDWLTIMTAHFSQQKSIVLGYGAYHKIEGSLLNALIRFETAFTAIQYYSYAMLGHAYMGVGRNLAYTAQEFYDNRGFMSHMRIMGGDDDLFVNEAATPTNTSVVLDPDAFTTSTPKKTWTSWWMQKRRHISTAKHYNSKSKFCLGLFYCSQLGFVLTSILVCFLSASVLPVLALILLRYIVVWVILSKAMSRFRESDLNFKLPFLELLLILSQALLFISNIANRPKQWN